jgi:hypothetical protein
MFNSSGSENGFSRQTEAVRAIVVLETEIEELESRLVLGTEGASLITIEAIAVMELFTISVP